MTKPTIDQFHENARVTWSVYGRVFTGTVNQVITEDTKFYKAGDMIVALDNPAFPGQTAVVTVGRSVNLLPGKPFPVDQ